MEVKVLFLFTPIQGPGVSDRYSSVVGLTNLAIQPLS